MSQTTPGIIKLNPKDNVAVAPFALAAGQRLESPALTLPADIPAGHKIAVAFIKAGEPVLKYGQVIGFATGDIEPGQHVHVHNIELHDFSRDYAIGSEVKNPAVLPEDEQASFMGYVRPDGRVGTRNFLGVITTVNCTASITHFLSDQISKEELARYPNVDGIVPIHHGSGCCVIDEGYGNLMRALAGFATHPNFAGVLVVGLGCETCLVTNLEKEFSLPEGSMLRYLNTQDLGGTGPTVQAGAGMLREMLQKANRLERQKVPARHLMLGLECGGSDAYSGITANPALGAAADLLVQNGGSAILSETPEIYGAEHLLTRRAVSLKVGEKLIGRIKWWQNYTRLNGAQINNNPTPGNKAGGISTIMEKSLGAVAKAGGSNLNQVYLYAEPVTESGLVFMDSPGYDAASITGMVAGGANLICFTTGRGTVYGSKPAPVIKLASNTPMYERMSGDMDINCGLVLDGERDIAQMGGEIFETMLAVASGQPTKSEALGYGDHEFVPWHIGVVM